MSQTHLWGKQTWNDWVFNSLFVIIEIMLHGIKWPSKKLCDRLVREASLEKGSRMRRGNGLWKVTCSSKGAKRAVQGERPECPTVLGVGRRETFEEYTEKSGRRGYTREG